MSITVLLNKENAPLKRMTVARVQLDATSPFLALTETGEGLLYGLTGKCTVYAGGACIGTLSGRQKMEEHHVQCIRFKGQNEIFLGVAGHAADLLWITCATMGSVPPEPGYQVHLPDTVLWHDVGSGTHQRKVAEVPRVAGYALDVGETHNIQGGWSSWPPHANETDLARFSNKETTWEEIFFVVCELPGIVRLKGIFSNGHVVNKVQEVYNGNAYVMPLGAHEIVAHPQSSLQYFWAYCGDALEKIYRKYSTDVTTYRK